MSGKFLRSNKINSISDFNKILREKSNALSTKFFSLHFAQSQVENSRLGIIIGKKSLKRAVDRNILKRNIREIFRKNFKENLSTVLVLVLFENFSMQNKAEFISCLKNSLNFLHNIKIL